MGKKGAYRQTDVKQVRIGRVLAESPPGAATAGMDVGKLEIATVIRWADGTFERPWRVKNPSEIRLATRLLAELSRSRELKIAMESTGTYGDPLRQALQDAKLDVQCVSGKAASDYAEIFDGVPSKHDGKDAAIVAELAALGKCWSWPYRAPTDTDAEMAYWADWLDGQQHIQSLWTGRLESQLARHWPEATQLLKLTSVTLVRLLIHYGGPDALLEDNEAANRLANWGRRPLTEEKITKILYSAKETVGVRQNESNRHRMKQYATAALSAYRETQRARRQLIKLAAGNEVIARQAQVVGVPTACILWVSLGDPHNYHCTAAYRKAMGLNLKERSSGKHQGKLKITRRGPGIVRKWLYFAAMRTVKLREVKPWYEAKKAKDGDRGKGALIGVMRRLAPALYATGAHGEPYEPWRLFPGRSIARQSFQKQQRETIVA